MCGRFWCRSVRSDILGDVRAIFAMAVLVVCCTSTETPPAAPSQEVSTAQVLTVGHAQSALRGTPTPDERASAVGAMQTRCARNEPDACAVLGDWYRVGTGVPRDRSRAIELLEAACEAGAVLGCARRGDMSRFGQGVPHDNSAAADWYARGCALGGGEACAHALSADPTRTVLRAKGCRVGGVAACAQLLGEASGVSGLWAPPTVAIGCAQNEPVACAALSLHQNDEEAWELATRRGCNLAVMPACMAWAETLLTREASDHAAARQLLDVACRHQTAGACERLARIYETGVGGPQDPQRAEALRQVMTVPATDRTDAR